MEETEVSRLATDKGAHLSTLKALVLQLKTKAQGQPN